MTDAQRLTEAVRADDRATVAAPISAGTGVNAADEPHRPPLFQAIEHQRIEIARRLIAAGADVNRDTGNGWTPLVHAIDIESDSAWQAHHETGHESTEPKNLLLSAGAWAELLVAVRALAPATALATPVANTVQRHGQRIEQLWRETLRYRKNFAYEHHEVRQVRESAEWFLIHSLHL